MNSTYAEELSLEEYFDAVLAFRTELTFLDSNGYLLDQDNTLTKIEARLHNDRVLHVERLFTVDHNLPDRGMCIATTPLLISPGWYKHLLYSPSPSNSYVFQALPTVQAEIDANDLVEADRQLRYSHPNSPLTRQACYSAHKGGHSLPEQQSFLLSRELNRSLQVIYVVRAREHKVRD